MRWNPAKVKRFAKKLSRNEKFKFLSEDTVIKYHNYLVTIATNHVDLFNSLITKEVRRGRLSLQKS